MEIEELKKLAKEVSKNGYASQSGFKVGSAILAKDGQVYTGCNVESPSLIFVICAERNAVSTAIAQAGNIEIDTVVIYTPTDRPTPPCGACRQLIYEFGKNVRVFSFCDNGKYLDTTIQKLLPEAFDLKEFQ
jgi:cytidine deaminase